MFLKKDAQPAAMAQALELEGMHGKLKT